MCYLCKSAPSGNTSVNPATRAPSGTASVATSAGTKRKPVSAFN